MHAGTHVRTCTTSCTTVLAETLGCDQKARSGCTAMVYTALRCTAGTGFVQAFEMRRVRSAVPH